MWPKNPDLLQSDRTSSCRVFVRSKRTKRKRSKSKNGRITAKKRTFGTALNLKPSKTFPRGEKDENL